MTPREIAEELVCNQMRIPSSGDADADERGEMHDIDVVERSLLSYGASVRAETIEECAKVAEGWMNEAERLRCNSARLQGKWIMCQILSLRAQTKETA
jgi:hypothetical protein